MLATNVNSVIQLQVSLIIKTKWQEVESNAYIYLCV